MTQQHIQNTAAGIFGVLSWTFSDWLSAFNATIGDISFYGGALIVVWTIWRMWKKRGLD